MPNVSLLTLFLAKLIKKLLKIDDLKNTCDITVYLIPISADLWRTTLLVLLYCRHWWDSARNGPIRSNSTDPYRFESLLWRCWSLHFNLETTATTNLYWVALRLFGGSHPAREVCSGALSGPQNITIGTFQGSCLGPLLFTIYYYQICSVIAAHFGNC